MKFQYLIAFLFIGSFLNAQIDSTRVDSLDYKAQDFISLSGAQLDESADEQEISGLLNASGDAFTNAASYNFSAARFRTRGLGGENFTMMLNGVRMNDPELGFAIWANWGGLNDITRRPESRAGISANPYHFGGINGFSNIDLHASNKRKGIRFSQSFTNRAYRQRSMLTYNTGKNSKGFSLSASLSGRWAKEGFVEGTTYSNMAYYLSLEKEFSDTHKAGFVALGSPSVRGRSGIVQQEILDLTGNNYYNPYWGWQNGEKRNARVRNSHKPLFFLWNEIKINEKLTISNNIFGQTGRYGQTRLNWFNAADPRPDYYRNLPSYLETRNDPEISPELATSLWQNDESYSQINWDHLYFANSKNLATVPMGADGDSLQGYRSKYILEESRSDPTMVGINSIFSNKATDNTTITVGLNGYTYKSENFEVVNDLLGGDFWLDINQFALRDFNDTEVAQNDLDNPNRIVKEGEKFGYDYEIHKNVADIFGQVEHSSTKFDTYVALNLGNTSFWRKGNVRNGLFPKNSKGESERKEFITGGLKAGLVYKISGRQFISLDGVLASRAPKTRNSFLSPRTRNEIVSDLKNENITSGEISYILRYPNLKMRLTGYYSMINNQVWSRSFYHDELHSFVNYTMTGVDHLHKGIEFGIENNVSKTVTASGALALGSYTYNSRPTATITVDNSSEIVSEGKTIYIQNYVIGGLPQTAANIGLRYRAPKFWWVGANFNYFADTWLDPNPDRRTESAVTPLVTDDPQWGEILDQTSLASGTSLNLSLGKSWRFQRKYYLLLVLNINNALDETDFMTGGYEQLRYDSADIGKFPNKVGYMYGRSYYAMVRFSF